MAHFVCSYNDGDYLVLNSNRRADGVILEAACPNWVHAIAGNGGGFTGDMTLPNGHYKLYWNFTGEHGFAKQKVFWVACGAPTPSPSRSA